MLILLHTSCYHSQGVVCWSKGLAKNDCSLPPPFPRRPSKFVCSLCFSISGGVEWQDYCRNVRPLSAVAEKERKQEANVCTMHDCSQLWLREYMRLANNDNYSSFNTHSSCMGVKTPEYKQWKRYLCSMTELYTQSYVHTVECGGMFNCFDHLQLCGVNFIKGCRTL